MPADQSTTSDHPPSLEEEDELKIHISRVPTKFDEAIVRRILMNELLPNDEEERKEEKCNIQVELIYPREEDDKNEGGKDDKKMEQAAEEEAETPKTKEHRGFGFVTFHNKELYEKALEMTTIKGGRKPASKKQHTMHLRAYSTNPEDVNQCYLWTQRRCPYGEECKFSHSGPGACLIKSSEESKKKKKGKCFAFKKGKCDKGDDCPFSHDCEPNASSESAKTTPIPNSGKDCINWKSKGKCRKGDDCPYRHDPSLLEKALEKKKRKRNDAGAASEPEKKKKQPLCIRVFGMAYETTEQDIRDFFQDCGNIQDVSFPTFEDSSRSKGYCGVWFTSPKAVKKAIELDGQELLGRWLSIQAGKMYLREWEANHQKQRHGRGHHDNEIEAN